MTYTQILDRIKKTYKEKENWDKNYPWLYFVIRPLSFPLSALCIKWGISANTITGISIAIHILSFIFLATGYKMGFILGSIMLVVFEILDCVDGNIARYHKPSKFGEYFDAIAGSLQNFTLAFLSLGLLNSEGDLLQGLPLKIAIVGGFLNSSMRYLTYIIYIEFHRRFKDEWTKAKQEGIAKGGSKNPLHRVIMNITDIQAHCFTLIILSMMHLIGVYIIFETFIQILSTGFIFYTFLKRAYKIS